MSVLLADTRYWIFDLDNTLYPAEAGITRQSGLRMRHFLKDRLAISDDAEAQTLQRRYFRDYGLTLVGLIRHHGVDVQDYFDHVYDLDLSAIAPSPDLAAALAVLPGRRMVFTNSPTEHAERVLDRLDCRAQIDAIFSIRDAEFQAKPAPEAYRRLIQMHAVTPEQAVMFEDIPRNLRPASDLGMRTAWIRGDMPKHLMDGLTEGDFDFVVDDLVGFLARTVAEQDWGGHA